MAGNVDANLILEEDYQESYEPTEEGRLVSTVVVTMVTEPHCLIKLNTQK